MLRPKDIKVLNVIIEHAGSGELIATQDQLAREAGYTNRSSVNPILKNLEREGFIVRENTDTGKKKKTETIRLNKLQPVRPVPVRGRIAAGQPILSSVDDIIEFVPLPTRCVRQTEVYMLEVRGDSMIGDGILDGDYVIVAREEKPRDGEIAVVFIGDEEATLKHIYYEGDSIRLKSSNPEPRPEFEDQIYGENDRPIVQGKVIGVVRWSA